MYPNNKRNTVHTNFLSINEYYTTAKQQGVPCYKNIEMLIEDHKIGKIQVDGAILSTPVRQLYIYII